MNLYIKKFLSSRYLNYKLILFLFIALYISIILSISFIYDVPYYQIWKFFGVPAKEIIFSDIHPFFVNDFCKINSVNAKDYYQQFTNCDNYKRLYNYMPIWVNFLKLGVHQRYSIYFGILFLLLFYLAFFKFISIKSSKDLFIYTLGILSPPAMLAVERGNTDLLIFFFCFVYMILLKKNNSISNILSYILIFFSSLIKFYPIFLVFIYFKRNLLNKIFGISIFLIFTFYLIINLSDIYLVKENTQQTFFFSYGYNVLEVGLNNIFYKLNLIFLASKNYLLGDYQSFRDGISIILYPNDFKNNYFIISRLLLLLVIFFFLLKWLKFKDINNQIPNTTNYLFFVGGASIFCGTFILGNCPRLLMHSTPTIFSVTHVHVFSVTLVTNYACAKARPKKKISWGR